MAGRSAARPLCRCLFAPHTANGIRPRPLIPPRRIIPASELFLRPASTSSSSSSSSTPTPTPPPSRYADDSDPVVRLAALALDSQTPTDLAASLSSLDPSTPAYAAQSKHLSDQESLRETWSAFKRLDEQLLTAEQMADNDGEDEEMRALAAEEADELAARLDALREDLSAQLFPPEPIHSSGALIELRPGIGGEESCMFVGEMTRMYERWCATHHPDWHVTLLSSTSSEVNGALKEAILEITGPGTPYGTLRFEAGIHRVQRIPVTTSVHKMQSSTMTIVVLPLADDKNAADSSAAPLVDPRDVKTEVMRSRGAGGQHVNKTESAIRLTHTPTGITVSMQDSRSQHANREKAWSILRSRLLDIRNREKEEHERSLRGEQIGGMTRGDRIRTYNFPQDRVTDHRVQSNANAITLFMEGTSDALGDFIQQLNEKERQGMLQARLRQLSAGGREGK